MDSVARIETAKRQMAEGRSSLVKAAQAGPACVLCRYYIPKPSGAVSRQAGPYCGHPAYSRPAFDPVEGTVDYSLATAPRVARGENGLCGIEAVLFEPRPIDSATATAKDVGKWVVGFFALLGAMGTVDVVSRLL